MTFEKIVIKRGNWLGEKKINSCLVYGLTSPSKLANIVNSFFVNKVRLIRENLPSAKSDPLRNLKQLMKNRTSNFSISPAHPDQIRKIISKLRNSKSSGVDQIDTYIVKLIMDEIVPAVTHIVNLSIEQKAFPTMWKLAKIIPLLKKDDPLEVKNYRPVAILPILSKVLERVVFLQIVEYMESEDLFHPNHHGFRSNHSTCSALLQMYDTWVEAVDRGELAGVCMLDMSAAFDVVDTHLLLQKLDLYGFDQGAVYWVKSYMTGRSQSVYIDGCMSSCLDLEVGVPQGSILGPLLYVCFTNDAPEVVHKHDDPTRIVHHFNTQCYQCGGLCCYADDSTFSVANTSPVQLSATLSSAYCDLATYLTDNRLKVNDEKTHLLVMTTDQKRRITQLDVVIQTPTEEIKPTTTEKLLGVNIHQNLKWHEYLQNNDKSLLKCLNQRLSALKLISHFSSFKIRLMIANGIFISKLIYVMPLWGGCEEYLLTSLQVVQNKAARFVTRCGRATPVKDLLKQCGWLSVRQLIFYHSVVQICKTLRTTYPRYLHQKVIDKFPYRTRLASSNSIRQGPQFKADLQTAKNSFRWRASAWYNEVPASIRQETKLNKFQSQLKTWVQENVQLN